MKWCEIPAVSAAENVSIHSVSEGGTNPTGKSLSTPLHAGSGDKAEILWRRSTSVTREEQQSHIN
jgi:hypothetical protein